MFLDHYYSDGKLEVVVPSFVHYLEVLEGSDGDKVPGMICRKLVISYVALDTPKMLPHLCWILHKYTIFGVSTHNHRYF